MHWLQQIKVIVACKFISSWPIRGQYPGHVISLRQSEWLWHASLSHHDWQILLIFSLFVPVLTLIRNESQDRFHFVNVIGIFILSNSSFYILSFSLKDSLSSAMYLTSLRSLHQKMPLLGLYFASAENSCKNVDVWSPPEIQIDMFLCSKGYFFLSIIMPFSGRIFITALATAQVMFLVSINFYWQLTSSVQQLETGNLQSMLWLVRWV